jgi:hypothetical protein
MVGARHLSMIIVHDSKSSTVLTESWYVQQTKTWGDN